MNQTKDSLKQLFNNLSENDYKSIADFHIHTTASDGKCSAKEIIAQARAKGLKHFSICDHNTFDGYKDLNFNDYPELVTGIEFDCWYRGIFLHLLGYGADINSEDLKPFLAKNKAETEKDIVRIFSTRNVPKLIEAIHQAGGLAVLAHSACCWTINHEHFVKCMVDIGLDGLETYYPYRRHRGIIKFHRARSVKKIAEKLNLIKTGGTDTHGSL
ncbi:MAG: PHP domain-containing protein [Candidatus Gastranaerophilales bacterium]|nr:PHP domain-containing protein [Candidatus Gastranaerophilales bacterium]